MPADVAGSWVNLIAACDVHRLDRHNALLCPRLTLATEFKLTGEAMDR